MKRILPALAVAALASSLLPTHAAGPYDGTWVFEAPAAKGGGGDYDLEECNAVRFEAQIVDNQIVGHLRPSLYPQSGPNVQTAKPGERGASPIQGTVSADGNLKANWQSYGVTGHLTGDKGQLSWKGQCGPRVAEGTRTAPSMAGTSAPKN